MPARRSQVFWSKELMYSCTLWANAEGHIHGDLLQGPTDGDLEAAQYRRIHHVLKTLRLKPGDRLLELGAEWGGLVIEVRPVLPCLCLPRPHSWLLFS